MGDKKYSFVEINKKRHGTPVLFSLGIQGTLKQKKDELIDRNLYR